MTTNPILYALPVFFASILLEAAVARRMGRRIYDLRDAITSLNFGTLSQITGAALTILSFGIYVAIYERFGARLWPARGWLAWFGALLIYDFLYYWAHRMGHEVGVLWAGHVVHHSSEYYNLSTALRQSSTGGLLAWVFYIPMAVLGVPPITFATVALADLLYQYWVHTQLIGRCGPLEAAFVTPSNHRVHHGQNDYCIDRNYGGILIVWDRLFGTFADERRDEKIVYGIRKPLESYNPVWGNLHVYKDLWNRAKLAPGLAGKIGAFLAPPAGWNESLPHFDAERHARYAPASSSSIKPYVAAQYALVSLAVTWFLAGTPGLTPLGGWIVALAATLSMICQGGLMQAVRWAIPAERLRLAAAGVAAVLMALLRVGPPAAAAAGAIACAASLLWLALATGSRRSTRPDSPVSGDAITSAARPR
ncbi:MAG: sterol desaturase family protein [Gammaproteobacteria bacterium]|nr:sterol desaturase family protein [Gammaproteobacteria bacterium]